MAQFNIAPTSIETKILAMSCAYRVATVTFGLVISHLHCIRLVESARVT